MSTARRDRFARQPGGALGTVLVGTALVLLLGIPSELIVKPLGAAGTPAQIMGVVMLVLWLGARVMGWQRPTPLGVVGWLLLIFATAMVLSYVSGMSRPFRNAEEVTSSDRAMISLAAWCGLALAVGAGLTTIRQLTTAMKILAGGVVVIAVLGILQFTVGLDVARLVAIPGLTANHPIGVVFQRSAYRRVSGTAGHPIEFGVVLSSVLPLVMHHARFATTAAARRRWWVGAGVVCAAVPMAVARSGVLGVAIVALVVIPTLPTRLRARVVLAVGVGAVAMSFLVPGLLGTLRGLFLNAGDDPSTKGRTEDYAPVLHYLAQEPLFGRGLSTFIPSLYRTLDNQYLGTAVEAGLVGLAALLALILGSVATLFWTRSRTVDPRLRDLCVCVAAGLLALGINAATFDLFGFAMAVGILFVLIGAAAAVTRLARAESASAVYPVPSYVGPGPAAPRWRRSAMVVGVLCCAAPVIAAGLVMSRAQPGYLAVTTFVVEPPLPSGQGDLRAAGSADGATSVLRTVLTGPQDRELLARAGVHDPSVVIGDASLMWGSDALGYGPRMTVAVEAPKAAAAGDGARTVLDLARSTLVDLQDREGVDPALRVRIDDVIERFPVELHARGSRALGASLLLTVLMVASGARVLSRTRPPPPPRARRRRPRPASPPPGALVGAAP